MRNLSIIRNCAYVLFCAVTAYAFEERLLAAMGDSLKNACQGWENGDGYDGILRPDRTLKVIRHESGAIPTPVFERIIDDALQTAQAGAK